MTSSNYSKYGNASPIGPDQIDPVFRCVGQTYFNKDGIPGSNMEVDMCPKFMAQRCSVDWDNYCEAYLYTSKTDQGGFNHINKEFLAQVAKKKYCRMDSAAPGAHCANKCEAFNPEAQTSVQVCETVGVQNWLDTKAEYDLGGNFPQSARLNPISPIYLGFCPEVCDAKTPASSDSLGPNDPVLNKCIEHGACSNVLMDLAYNVVKDNIPVSNPAFQKIIDYAKLDKPINPNIAAKIAANHGIPPQDALKILESAKYGGVSNHVASPPASNSPAITGHLKSNQSIVVSPTENKNTNSLTASYKQVVGKEGFYAHQINHGKRIMVIVGIFAAIILFWIIWRNRAKSSTR